uniref:AlNc14C1091G12771 protein n=1 Tax=Albugo laibachii Nc14 TaxID=890382 RepID=F0X2I0_9STRA|nr:AlNc14C1091G12771 [Albugo laibachii Nc14]|eukprot:CCA28081.1 AlNc14C1091G12771 [Albugo laibachii Nc14]
MWWLLYSNIPREYVWYLIITNPADLMSIPLIQGEMGAAVCDLRRDRISIQRVVSYRLELLKGEVSEEDALAESRGLGE